MLVWWNSRNARFSCIDLESSNKWMGIRFQEFAEPRALNKIPSWFLNWLPHNEPLNWTTAGGRCFQALSISGYVSPASQSQRHCVGHPLLGHEGRLNNDLDRFWKPLHTYVVLSISFWLWGEWTTVPIVSTLLDWCESGRHFLLQSTWFLCQTARQS